MPIYTYIDEDGNEIDLMKPVSKMDPIGTVIEHEGRKLTRVFCGSIDAAGIARKTWGYPRASEQLPRGLSGCKHDAKGRPIITSRKHERELTARHGLVEME